MTLSIPAPATIAQRFAAWLLSNPVQAEDGSQVVLDANVPGSVEQVLASAIALEMAGVYRYARDWCLELMVTTATENGLLPDHAVEWSTPRIPAQAAIGNVDVTISSSASASAVIPIGQTFTLDGTVNWVATAETTIAAGAVGAVPVQASVTGTTGNLAAGTTLTAVTPIVGASSCVVDGSGLAGGAAQENAENWRARIIDAIRNPPGGGTRQDYERWAEAAGAAYVNVIPQWLGVGTVGVAVAMAGRVAPTDAQLLNIQLYLEDVSRRVVRANVTVMPAEIVTRNVVLSITPDTEANRTEVQAAIAAYYAGTGLGDTLYASQLSDAVSSVTTVTSHIITSPADNETLAANQLAVLGAVLWSASS
ncbi:hypothetical protein AA0472_1126 [Acetobacter estunensis NRIC 0472]|uniref:Baseplate protein J-like domain-containing protein n=1 Tax=Acetobacter estunensis TaxID=104097 RepID=A0A967B5L3_9PROT|nr:baseplate J/gp47 family protein [Acetobacter estunensis]NHO53308.1 hypothetical protein [Acetobacter estunensis]GBQ23523.1 hypothetical protein AA0472_1126 [Acetobacter estunensis NRIC 0472]